MPTTIASSSTIASAANWGARAGWFTSSAAYVTVTDTTNNKLRAYKSTNGTTWTEQDSANAPAVTASRSYSTWLHTDGYLYTIRYSATQTLRVRRFNTATDTWETTDSPNSDVTTTATTTASSLRIVVRSTGHIVVMYSDGTNVRYRRYNGSTWGTDTVLQATATKPNDAVVDASDRTYFLWADTTNSDLTYVTLDSSDALGTVTDIDTTIHTTAPIVATQMARFNDGTNAKIGLMVRDSTGEIDFWHGTEGATLGTLTAVGTVSTATTVGQQGAVAAFNSRIYVMWTTANAILMDHTLNLSTLTFNSVDDNILTGLTDADPCPQFIEQDQNALGVLYNDGGSVKVEWIVAPTPSGEIVPVACSIANSAAVTANTAINVLRPPLAVLRDNDVCVMVLNSRSTVDSTFTVAGGTGTWVEEEHKFNTSGSCGSVWVKRIATAASEPANYTYQFNQSNQSSAILVIYRNVDTTTILNAEAVEAAGTSTTASNSLTPSTNKTRLVYASVWDASTSSTINTRPTGYNQLGKNISNARTVVYDQYQATAAASSPSDVSSVSEDWIAFLFALQPTASVVRSYVPSRRLNVLVRR